MCRESRRLRFGASVPNFGVLEKFKEFSRRLGELELVEVREVAVVVGDLHPLLEPHQDEVLLFWVMDADERCQLMEMARPLDLRSARIADAKFAGDLGGKCGVGEGSSTDHEVAAAGLVTTAMEIIEGPDVAVCDHGQAQGLPYSSD